MKKHNNIQKQFLLRIKQQIGLGEYTGTFKTSTGTHTKHTEHKPFQDQKQIQADQAVIQDDTFFPQEKVEKVKQFFTG